MNKIFKIFILLSSTCVGMLPISLVSCTKENTPTPGPTPPEPDPCDHEKGELLSLKITNSNVYIPAYFKCKKCGHSFIDHVSAEEVHLPILDVIGSLSDISKENEIKVTLDYKEPNNIYNFQTDATIKLQGATGAFLWPKKNYTIKLFKNNSDYREKLKVRVKDDWNKYNRYTLKANYDDVLLSHNITGAKVFGQIAHQWNDKHLEDEKVDNYGAVDGFPILLYNTGTFLGVYTLNLNKHKSLFNMDDSDVIHEALLFSSSLTSSTRMSEPIAYDMSNGWKVEFCSTGDEDPLQYKWMVDSFNEVINFTINNDGIDFKNGIGNYINVDRTLDYLVFMEYITLPDNVDRNSLWVKYDDEKWYPSAYDMDFSLGHNLSREFYSPEIDFSSKIKQNLLFKKMLLNFQDEYAQHYHVLRQQILTGENIINQFHSIYDGFTDIALTAERKKWPYVEHVKTNTVDNLEYYAIERGNFLDKKYQ